MRSAQRRAKIEKGKSRDKKMSTLVKVFIPFLVVLVAFLFLKITTKYWDGRSKISFVFQKENGDTGVTILDPELSEETTLIIPGDTQINVAHGYGTFRIKNVWQLGLNEKLGGSLLAQTVTNNFTFPTFLWSEVDLNNTWKFVFLPKLNNISFGDRLSMALFSLRVKSIDKTEIDLGRSQFLKKQVLTDGAPGYIVSGPISGRLTVYFSDSDFSRNNLRFGLIDATNAPGVANEVGSILEVLGGKVVSIDKITGQDIDCQVSGKNKDAVNKIAILFGCTKVVGKSDFDSVIEMGTKFSKRF